MGLGESYMDGWWECERLDMFFSSVLRAGLENSSLVISKIPYVSPPPACSICKVKRAWIVGKEHYDLGNDLFSRMLDPLMQYSCGYWKKRRPGRGAAG